MNPLLLTGFGISISVNKRKLIIVNKLRNERFEFYPHQISHDAIIVDGHTGNITFEAIRWLMKHDINLTILNWNGNLLGTVLPQNPKTAGRLRLRQYAKYMDGKTRYEVAKRIVQTKIANSVNLLKELSKYYVGIDIESETLKQIADSVPEFNSIQPIGRQLNALLMTEGQAADMYWLYLTKIFNRLYPEFHFQSRKNKSYSWNMNASDEINALLNYGYAILESEIRKNINAIGLEPTIGFLHEIDPSKTPLIYDIQELFRWLIDLSVIELLEEKKLKKSDFIVTENYHIRLRENTAKLLIEKIKINFNRKAVNYKHGKNYSYQNILFDNIQQLANFILDKNKHVQFNIPAIKIQRNDFLDIQQKIMNMTPKERRQAGINKSTLWYQKKNLAEGKRIKVYRSIYSKLI